MNYFVNISRCLFFTAGQVPKLGLCTRVFHWPGYYQLTVLFIFKIMHQEFVTLLSASADDNSFISSHRMYLEYLLSVSPLTK